MTDIIRIVHNRIDMNATTAGKPDLKGLFPDELSAMLAATGAPSFRGAQLFAWMHRRLAADFTEMTDLPAVMRDELQEHFSLTMLSITNQAAATDGAVKYLFALEDGQTIETVMIPEPSRVTVCVSTMVGCPFGCIFCATGQGGFTRNLTAAEIIEQVYRVQIAAGGRVTNVVYMGMGEPLANYDAVLRSVRLLIHPRGLNLAQRHITLSTVGLTPGIERLAAEGLQVNLALSLHAPTQAGRLRLLPIAKKYPLEEVMAAMRNYVKLTGRKVTFEYTVLPGMNDTAADAAELASQVHHLQCLVNVIPLNPLEGLPPGSKAPARELQAAAQRFTDALSRLGVEATLRRSRGGEIAGACGQLKTFRKRSGG